MGFLKGIFSLIGFVVVAAILVAFLAFGGKIAQVKQLDPAAMGSYMKMFGTVLETGNAAKGMVEKVKVEKGVTPDEIKDAMEAIAGQENMQLVGDVVMFDGSVDGKGKKTLYTRIYSFCSRTIASDFLNFSPEFGAFMPCRIMLREEPDGTMYLYTMSLDLMIRGGHTLPKELYERATHVESTMHKLMEMGAKGDF